MTNVPSGAAMMRVSDKGLMEIIGHEALVLSPYYDSVGVLTIGVGHTKAAGGLDPASRWGKPLSVAEAMELFRADIEKYAADVRKAFKRQLSQPQFDAATSFHFNTGAILKASWVKDFNAGRDADAKKHFMNWRKPPEIIGRRTKERDLFFAGAYGDGMATIFPADAKGKVLWTQGKPIDLTKMLPLKDGTVTTDMIAGKPAADFPKKGERREAVAVIQRRLKELGYTEVGNVDGVFGDMTEKAILIARHDLGLPLTPTIDGELNDALLTAKPRPLPASREGATPADVREKVPEAKDTWWSKIVAFWSMILTALFGGLNFIIENIGDAKSAVKPITDLLGKVPLWTWALLLGGGLLTIWLKSRTAGQRIDTAYQEGARR